MSKVKILYLEAAEADAESIGSLVNIVREVQSAREAPAVIAASTQTFDEPPEQAVAALPAPKVRKPRAPKVTAEPDHDRRGTGGRVNNAGPQLIAALRKNSRPDPAKLAKLIYGDETKTSKIRNLLGYLAANGKLKNNGDGTYTVLAA